MALYAESSAVLSWLLGEAAGVHVGRALASADNIISSDLTLVECERVIHRGVHIGAIRAGAAAKLRTRLNAASVYWNILHISSPIVSRARQPFPEEPIRTLDALHIACALHARTALQQVELLSLDERIRRVGRSLGFVLAPA